MNLIKIKVNEEDRETLASMLDYAIHHIVRESWEAVTDKKKRTNERYRKEV